MEALRGKSGFLTLTRLAVDSYEREEYLLFSGFDDSGASLDQETMEKLFACSGRVDRDEATPAAVSQRLAAEGEHGNIKPAEGKDRVFLLTASGESGRDFIAEEEGELSLRFEYRPATLTDWPEDAREGKTKPPAQKDLIALAKRRVLAVSDAALNAWIAELGRPHITANGGENMFCRRLPAKTKEWSTP